MQLLHPEKNREHKGSSVFRLRYIGTYFQEPVALDSDTFIIALPLLAGRHRKIRHSPIQTKGVLFLELGIYWQIRDAWKAPSLHQGPKRTFLGESDLSNYHQRLQHCLQQVAQQHHLQNSNRSFCPTRLFLDRRPAWLRVVHFVPFTYPIAPILNSSTHPTFTSPGLSARNK